MLSARLSVQLASWLSRSRSLSPSPWLSLMNSRPLLGDAIYADRVRKRVIHADPDTTPQTFPLSGESLQLYVGAGFRNLMPLCTQT